MRKKKEIIFFKLHASGNDFILLDARSKSQVSKHISYKALAKKICARRFSVGADGLLVIEPSRVADFKMRIFNPDGSEAEMCGNGARCVGFWAALERKKRTKLDRIHFETQAGIIEALVTNSAYQKPDKNKRYSRRVNANVKIRMSDVDLKDVKLLMPFKVSGRYIKINCVNTGVPHVVIFVRSLSSIDVVKIGKEIRFHYEFKPQGTNVDFVEVLRNDLIMVRTYERGLERETLACGTGVVASAVASWFMTHGMWVTGKKTLRVRVKSNDVLKVHFLVGKEMIENVWLEGRAYFVYKGKLS